MTNLKGLLTSFLCICLLASCTAKPKNKVNPADISDANAAYTQGADAKTSGLGQESGFGDKDRMDSEQMLSKRIYYFDFDSNAIHEEDKAAIEANADFLIAHPMTKIIIEGHTDPRGSREYNIGLGERRAKAVSAILTSLGVKQDQIRLVSYGAQKNVSVNHTDEDYQKDRRAIIVYTN